MYHEQRFVIGYDDEWFAKEILVKFATPLTMMSDVTCSNMVTVLV